MPQAYAPERLARWINEVTGVKPHKGVSPKHGGVHRLSLWIRNRLHDNPKSKLSPGELLTLAKAWMPEHFEDFQIDVDRIEAIRIQPAVMDSAREQVEARWEHGREQAEEQALGQLLSSRVDHRVRGLKRLHDLGVEDLCEWCAMCVDDPDVEVQAAAIEAMRDCEDVEAEGMEAYVDDDNKLLRAAAVSFLIKHGEDRDAWFRAGLTDPEPHVRVTTAQHLDELDPMKDRSLFELALYDPNAKVAEAAGKFTSGRGYHLERW